MKTLQCIPFMIQPKQPLTNLIKTDHIVVYFMIQSKQPLTNLFKTDHIAVYFKIQSKQLLTNLIKIDHIEVYFAFSGKAFLSQKQNKSYPQWTGSILALTTEHLHLNMYLQLHSL